MRIFVVAPYSPPTELNDLVNLAASKKIELIIKILSSFSSKIIIVNSAHNSIKNNRSYSKKTVIGGVKVIEIIPFTIKNRKIGKFLNLLFCFFTSIKNRYKNDLSYLWLYNGYSFECLFSLLFATPHKLIIEIEDLPMSRKRGWFELKDRLDKFLFKKAIKQANLLTFVNGVIKDDLYTARDIKKIILPSLISKKLDLNTDYKPPFSKKNKVIGYFGGLSRDKGAETLINLAKNLPSNWTLLITGMGQYRKAIESLSKETPNVNYLGVVDENRLYVLMAQCDVLLNPHSPIDKMNDGIFPFKICEYLVTERLVLSTSLPKVESVIDSAILYYDNSLENLLFKLEKSEYYYNQYKTKILLASTFIRNNYTEESLVKLLHAQLFNENP